MTNVADLHIGGPDSQGETILCFYGRKPPEYAVYRARRRVSVHFADDLHKEAEQRRDLSQLAPLRGEIDGLIDGWRDGSTNRFFGLDNSAKLKSKAQRYDRRVGDALVVGLEDDLTAAGMLLNKVKEDILNERVAWARFEYLLAALATALGLMFAAWLLSSIYPIRGEPPSHGRMDAIGLVVLLMALVAGVAIYIAGTVKSEGWSGALVFALIAIPVFTILVSPSFSFTPVAKAYVDAVDLWRAAAAGSVGAFFSISLAIRGRTVLPDLLRTSNIMDAALRVMIGFIAGAVLMALLKLGVVDFQFGARSIAASGPLAVVIIGFVAGFSERLVPDLLKKADAKAGDSTAVLGGGGQGAAKQSGKPAEGDQGQPPPAADRPEPDPVPEQSGEDACASDIDLEDEDVTRDADLPPATGGVEMPSEGETK